MVRGTRKRKFKGGHIAIPRKKVKTGFRNIKKKVGGRRGSSSGVVMQSGMTSKTKLLVAGHKLNTKVLKLLSNPIRVIVEGNKSVGANGMNYAKGEYLYMDASQFDIMAQLGFRQRAVSASGSLPAAIPGRTFKAWIQSFYVEQKYINMSNMAVKLIIYDVKVKRDTSSGPFTCVQNDVAILNQNRDTTITNDAALATLTPGYSPMDSLQFRTHWKIVRRVQVHLDAGGVHEHIIQANYNKIISRNVSVEDNYLKGYSFGVYIEVQPYPIVDGVTHALPSVAPPASEVLMTSVGKFSFREMGMTPEHIEVTNIWTLATNPTTVVDESGLVTPGVTV
ncbi:putative capsid protein [Lolium perenne-associated virus]|uniref:putative capsid protein n=1 Tax=Lolium perenne-associated virus TaxID=2282644 RepID=UPI000DF61398|nr:putative capsid protein [Lolium perenne-associated virus]AXF50878.1 putative capsid protein [Lolium perenne-associated virus]